MLFKLYSLKSWLIIILLLFIGFLGGWLGFLLFGDIAKACNVVFVSKEAVLKAEEARIKESKESLFLGRPREALKQMIKIVNSFENRRTKILFISSSTGSAKGGQAISVLVHEQLINYLRQTKKQEGKSE